MPVVFAFFSGPLPWVILAVVTVACLWVDLHFFARGREPSFREGAIWSVGWLVFSLLVLISLFVGDFPMALVFNGFELASIVLAVLIAQQVTHEGESTWFEGVQLLAVYAVLGLTFFFV